MTVVNETTSELNAPLYQGAVLDDAHIGYIHGALGTIRHGDTAPRNGLRARWQTLVAILGPGRAVGFLSSAARR